MSRIVESLYRVSDVEVTESLAKLTPEQQLIYDVNASLMGPDWSLEQVNGQWVMSDWYDEEVFDSTEEMINFCKQNIEYTNDDVLKQHLEDNTWEYGYSPEEVGQIKNYIADILKNRGITLGEDLDKALNESLDDFVKVEPEYTGGNIYCFLGQLKNNKWFLADDSYYDVRIVNADVFAEDPDEVWQPDWQEAHLVKDLSPEEALDFFTDMLAWVKANAPEGNYAQYELDATMEEIEHLKTQKNWR